MICSITKHRHLLQGQQQQEYQGAGAIIPSSGAAAERSLFILAKSARWQVTFRGLTEMSDHHRRRLYLLFVLVIP
jgi:hypothetical protein